MKPKQTNLSKYMNFTKKNKSKKKSNYKYYIKYHYRFNK